MGSGNSVLAGKQQQAAEAARVRRHSSDRNSAWRMHPRDDEELIRNPQIPNSDDVRDFAEFLSMLKDSIIGQRYIGRFARQNQTHNVFFFWIDVEEYKTIPTAGYRLARARHIFKKYLAEDAQLEVGISDAEERNSISRILETAQREDKTLLGPELFDVLQKSTFQLMYYNTYLPFKKSETFAEYQRESRETFNRIDVSDFDYFEKLGEGAFGRVVHVRKQSTGRHYAMKVQSKRGLLQNFRDDYSKLNNEKTVFAACNHPYIVEMNYAFSTKDHAILVLELIPTGTLQDAIDACRPARGLPEASVVLYTAEIILALDHLHEMGLMYRDLKPRNVLLGADGHIKLADMGGVSDFSGSVFSNKIAKAGDDIVTHAEEAKGESDHEIRTVSIMGTKGYMAPEMVRLMLQGRSQRSGYTRAVDYWSLGVTVYKMLTRKRPLVEARESAPRGLDEYQLLLREVPFPRYIQRGSAVHDLIRGLLEVKYERRLGSGPEGVNRLKNHAFFESINWEKLEQKQISASYLPRPRQPLMEVPLFSNFAEMMADIDTDHGHGGGDEDDSQRKELTEEEQRHFNDWDYISALTLKRELGIAREMEVLDENVKARQILGPP